MESAKETVSNEGRLVDKNKVFDYPQKAADMGNINGIYGIGDCYQNGFGIEEDEHKAFEYYKKSTDIDNSNGAFMVVTDEEGDFDLDSIEGKSPEKRNHEGPDDNHHQNMDLCRNSIKPVLVNKFEDNCVLIKMDSSHAEVKIRKPPEGSTLAAIPATHTGIAYLREKHIATSEDFNYM
ncbi:hypothetical protein C2G38_2154294 [Gigaspora rosea]|uniref:Uncharacterized protein n=1 Tax=Gigaspora rosea TaxID=44941 RepID=A0A397W6B7_9GLOM|nr:hypothetical protein C2G38_2154294 [Gigaspora rosea]